MRSFTLGCCLATAVCLAFAANQSIDAVLHDTPLPAGHTAHHSSGPLTALDPARLARALGTPLRPAPLPAPRRAQPLKLLGTLDGHAASLLDPVTGQCRTLRAGDAWDDLELVDVGHGQVTIRRAGQLEALGVGAIAASAGSPVPLSIALTSSGATLALSRSELERQLPTFAQQAMTGARLIPAFSNSTMTGLKLFAIRPGSLYEQLGMKNGDIFESVNGVSLSNSKAALGLLDRLRDERHIALVVNRGGERLTWELNVE